jgi:biopolymer transport protein ExbD
LKLFSSIDASAFASIVVVLLFTVMVFEGMTASPHHGTGVDMARVSHPISMPGALREDRLQVTITRDGKVYFGSDHVDPYSLPERLRLRLNDHGVERKVYIKADARVWYGTVKVVLDGVRSAGILRVAFLVDQKRSQAASR